MNRYRQFLSYEVAIGSTAIAVLLTHILEPFITQSISIFFFVAITISTWYGGLKPGFVAIILSTISINYFFLPPLQGTHQIISDFIRLTNFSLVSIIVHLLSRDLGNSQRRVKQLIQQLLEESADRLKTALNAAQMGMWDWDLTTGQITWSPEHELLFGLAPGTFDGKYETFDKCLHPDDRDALNQAIARSLNDQSPYQHEYRIIWADGSIHWVEGRGRVICNPSGRPARMTGTVMAIDERKHAQLLLQQQFEQQRLVMEITQRIRQSLSLQNILQTTVDEVRQVLHTDRVIIFRFFPDGHGVVAVESCGADWTAILSTEIYDPCFSEQYIEPFRQGLVTTKSDIYTAGLQECHLELLSNFQVRANLVVPILQNDELWGLLIAHHCEAPRHWQDSEIDLLRQIASQVGIALQQSSLLEQVEAELNERKRTEAALQDSQLQLQQQLAEIEAIYQSSPIGLNVLDPDLRFVRINERLAEINGLSVEAHLGRTVREVLPHLADTAEQLLRPILETGEPLLNVEISGQTPAQPGVQRTWLESFLPLKEGDRIIGISTVCEEITDRKRAEEDLRRAKEELEIRVAERTAELQEANTRLQQELLQRMQIEQRLRQSEARYRAILEDQTELIVRFASDSTLLFVNDAFCRYFNIKREEILGQSYTPVIYEADREKVAQLIRSMTVETPVIMIENRVIDGRGNVRWTQWVNRMLFDPQGHLIEFQAVGRDITELKQAEQALRDSEERLQLALEASGDGIWDWNMRTGEVYYSPQYFQMLGYDADEWPHEFSTWEQLVHPDDMRWVKETLADHLRDSSVRYAFDYRLRTKAGEWKWVADYGKVVAWDDNGTPLRMIGTHRDVNERKLIEAALRQSEEQRRLALDLTHLGFWDLHIPSGELTWNDNQFSLLGLSPGSTKPHYQEWRDRIHPEDVERVEQLFNHSIDTHTNYEAEYRVVYPDGSLHWLMARGRAIYDEHHQPLRSLGVALDISDRKDMEASLQEFNRRWRSLLDDVQLVVIGLDTQGNVEYANPFFLELTGFQLEEVIGQSWFDGFLTPGQKIATKIVFQEVLEHGFHKHHQNPIVTQSGEERMIAWSNTVLRDTSGRTIGTMSIGEDITERYKVERMKAEFISMVSHELRTPLTSMQAALSLLSEKIVNPMSEEGEATIQIATEGTDRLVRLVNDILDLERLESGKVRLDKRQCDVDALVETAIAQMQEMANQVDITLEAVSGGFQVEADSDRLLQVLTNLLSNAIKFSPSHSTVQISVELQPSTPPSFLLVTVHDEGRGIPADKLESIFDRFHQVDASDSRTKGGTGLGLAICRSIVQQHGGEIWAESTLSQGSTFYFTIPTDRKEEPGF